MTTEASFSSQKPNDRIREQAAEWLVELDSKAQSTQQQAAFQRWLAQDDRHRHIYEQMERLWHGAALPRKPAVRSGQLLSLVGLFLLLTLLSSTFSWDYWQADYRTAIGEVSTITLPDGSTATLNTHSAIDIDFDQGRRNIRLIQGEVLLEVRKDPQRPFVVSTPSASAEALGTRYSVARLTDQSVVKAIGKATAKVSVKVNVKVYESKVRVSTASGRASRILREGQQAQVDREHIQLMTPLLPAAPDWARQRLVFHNASLSEVIERLRPYHNGVLTLAQHSQDSPRRFTGVLPSNDIQTALKLLADSMDLQASHISPYFTYLSLHSIQ